MQNVEKFYADNAQTKTDKAGLNSTICWFCDKTIAEDESAEIYLHKFRGVSMGLTGNTYEYLVLSRRIPCCRICSRTHENTRQWSRRLMILGGIAGFIVGLILPFVIVLNLEVPPDKEFGTIVLLTILGGTVCGAILGYLLGHKIAFAPGTKPETYARQHPLIEPLMGEGWKIGKPE